MPSIYIVSSFCRRLVGSTRLGRNFAHAPSLRFRDTKNRSNRHRQCCLLTPIAKSKGFGVFNLHCQRRLYRIGRISRFRALVVARTRETADRAPRTPRKPDKAADSLLLLLSRVLKVASCPVLFCCRRKAPVGSIHSIGRRNRDLHRARTHCHYQGSDTFAVQPIPLRLLPNFVCTLVLT